MKNASPVVGGPGRRECPFSVGRQGRDAFQGEVWMVSP